jgi:predicted phosphodiesterase
MGDTHLGSKYERLDCLNRLYDRYQSDGIATVLHAGNWIEGEARFNVFDLLVHGMDAQCQYLADNYPVRSGMNTYAVAGDDHEGWYCQKTGVNIGEYAEGKMRKAGRTDWHDLGYMESHVKLTNANTGKSAVLALVHPGGGSAYALSYTMQKLVESYEGGEKPAVLIMGHYHKLMAANIRNVWCIQSGCFQDQTPFMRKKRLEAHVGGVIVSLKQDPETGAIVECLPNIIRYFNRAYYSGRWSHSGPVVLPERS